MALVLSLIDGWMSEVFWWRNFIQLWLSNVERVRTCGCLCSDELWWFLFDVAAGLMAVLGHTEAYVMRCWQWTLCLSYDWHVMDISLLTFTSQMWWPQQFKKLWYSWLLLILFMRWWRKGEVHLKSTTSQTDKHLEKYITYSCSQLSAACALISITD